jgi:miniconductance mechanosensitive channel
MVIADEVREMELMVQDNQAPASGVEGVVQSILSWLQAHPITQTALALVALVLVAYLADIIARRRVLALVNRLIRRTTFGWDDALHHHKVFERLAHLTPAAVVYFGGVLVPGLPSDIQTLAQNVAAAFMLFIVVLTVGATLSAGNEIYEQFPIAKTRPIKGYLQVAKILTYALGGVVVVAALLDRSPFLFLSGIGAMTAVLLLVFKDTLLSLVASIQLTNTGLVRVGDWIEMPKYGADGDVIDIALHTVKVQNWDKTITSIPTHKLIEDSFKNWRGMSESGGRRIKRSIFLDKHTVRFLTEEEVGRFRRFTLLKDYVEEKQKELQEYNARIGATDDQVNLRRLTNIGTFRAYIVNYLKNHPQIHDGMTLLVRQLEPAPNGVPIQIYVFANETAWVAFEDIQSDIFDHFMAIVPEFGLRLFQNPSGDDLRRLVASPST